ncbi:hypothetical protein AX660_17375 [Paraglaciecola hydrolytica]|uniref:Fimbrial assembly protein n=2 Tax=Paraglaciecola hydrolytica TaxID=1799789 RepID=A0A135ZYU6_9ALTE|nr:hypothetical protein AX660_17375 [Paraglaciecola hydrolytica]
MGFYLSPYNSGSVHSKIWNVKLFSIVFCGSLALYISVSSAYLIVKTQLVSTSIEQNQSMANELINADKNLRKLATELKKLTVFERSSPRPISLLAKLPLDADVITFNRFQLVGNDLQIFGETKNSATDILDLLLKSNEFKDVKFTLPVSKSRDGKEIFVIEAKIIDGK